MRLPALAPLVLLCACGSGEPRWITLASLPVATRAAEAGSNPTSRARWLRAAEVGGEEWIEVEIPRSAWQPMGRPGAWRMTPPLRSLGRGLNATARLTSGERSFVQLHAPKGSEPAVQAGSFGLVGTWLVLQLAEGEAPPERSLLAERVERRSLENGRARVDGRRFSGAGFSVWPGERAELTLDVPPASVLHLATVVEALLDDEEVRRCRFRVRLDGRTLLDHEQLEARDGSLVHHALTLPAEGADAARLELEVQGSFAACAFLEPVIAPATPPTPERPDILLFVADTFRADNLTACGGALGLTPNLDALAAESLCFTNARSVATYTLPAHASLFSGFYPHQVSADAFERSLPEGVETIAERLSAAGYRTGAVTGAVIVSRSFGMSQGFERFDELRAGMDSTLERVESFLAAGDGRPTFLLVHTYRVHSPYESSAEARERLELAAGRRIEADFSALNGELEKVLPKDAEVGARARELAASLELLYRAGVSDFDAEFARFLAAPAVRRLAERGYLFFTSDHGEAFLEHGEVYHAGRVFEEQLDIPLLLRGPGIRPGVRTDPVSLLDLAPTLADLAGLAPLPGWAGRSLREQGDPRPYLFAFECRADRPETLAVIASERKLIGRLDQAKGELLPPLGAFDLVGDPGEGRDLLGSSAPWPVELQSVLERRRAELIQPLFGSVPAELGSEQGEDLKALGYGGR